VERAAQGAGAIKNPLASRVRPEGLWFR
jgi:hypothetical protein